MSTLAFMLIAEPRKRTTRHVTTADSIAWTSTDLSILEQCLRRVAFTGHLVTRCFDYACHRSDFYNYKTDTLATRFPDRLLTGVVRELVSIADTFESKRLRHGGSLLLFHIYFNVGHRNYRYRIRGTKNHFHSKSVARCSSPQRLNISLGGNTGPLTFKVLGSNLTINGTR